MKVQVNKSVVVYRDVAKESFCRSLQGCFPNYKKAYDRAGIDVDERKDARYDKKCKYHDVYLRVEEEVELEMLEQAMNIAVEGNAGAINVAMKDIEKRRVLAGEAKEDVGNVDGWFSELGTEKPKAVKAKKAPKKELEVKEYRKNNSKVDDAVPTLEVDGDELELNMSTDDIRHSA